MIEKFKPDMYKKSIYDIDYKKLKKMGIKCLLFDLDNTLAPSDMEKPSRKTKDFIEKLKDMDFKIIIFSNACKNRIRPFKSKLEVDCAASARKPSKKKYKKVLAQYKYAENEVAMIGDQIMTDVFGGNKVGILTILVDPIKPKELFFTKINRFLEKRIMRKLKRANLFVKGNYYD